MKATKKAKTEYLANLNTKIVYDNKRFWKTMKPLFSDKKCKNQKIVLVENDEIIKDSLQTAEIMNSYFVNIAKNLEISEFVTEKFPKNTIITSIDPIDHIIHEYSKHPSILKIKETTNSPKSFSFNIINNMQMRTEILDLNTKKSSGHDSIPPKIIKGSAAILSTPLKELFNISIKECLFPSDLKYADVAPLFKNDDNTNKENYRPMSILPSISKLFERLIFQQISSHVANKLSPFLFGFRKGYNAHHALLRLKNKLNMSLDNKQNIGLFMIDLSKALDCIPHNLLIAKLHAYGFAENSLKLIYSYLEKRNQRVKINSEFSSWKEILSGVPQGSVLGPLLFNIFINDLFFFVEHSDICNYADDNSLSVADVSIDHIISKLELDIRSLDEWFQNNYMLLNQEKCQFMIIESSRAQ